VFAVSERLYGRTFEQAVDDVLEGLEADPYLDWIGADGSEIAESLARWLETPMGAPHVAEALWRHYEWLNPIGGDS
jgi:hypothetical protein